MDNSTPSRWYSLDEIAAHIGITRETCVKWIKEKSLPAYKVGKVWRFKVEEVDRWVKNMGDASEETAGE